MHIKRTIASILFTLIAVFGVFSIAPSVHAQYGGYVYVPTNNTSNSGSTSTNEEKQIQNDSETEYARAKREYDYVQGIYNRGDAATQEKIKPILDDSKKWYSEASENKSNVYDALRIHNVTLAHEKLDYLRSDADKLAENSAKADTVVGKTRDQVIAESQAADGKSCFNSVGMPTNIQVCVRSVIGSVLYIILALFAFLVELGGKALDLVIQFSIVDVKSNIESITAINTGWIVFRDIANLSFIFILLYVAIGTILQTTSLQWRQLLVRIILAAILINFSMFITKVLVDASNVVTLVFYNGTIEVAKAAFPALATTDKASDLSNAFMSMLGIQSLYNANTVNQWAQSWEALATSAIGGIAVMFVAAFSFLSAAWLFIIRYVAIIFLIILSPLAFAARALPRLDKQWDRWKTMLTSQLLFPIIYMIGIWLTVLIGSNMIKIAGANTSLSQGFVSGASSSAINGVIRYIFIIIMLNATLLMAKSQATKAGGKVKEWMDAGTKKVDSWRARTKGAAKSAGGYVARETVGRQMMNLNKKLGNVSGKSKAVRFAGQFVGVGNTRIANYVRGGTVGALANSKYGTAKTAKQYKDEGRAIAAKEREITQNNEIEAAIERNDSAAIAKLLEKMSNKQIESLGTKDLMKPAVLANLDSSEWSALMSSSEKTDEDKEKLKIARYNLLKDIKSLDPKLARKFVKTVSANDLKNMTEDVFGTPGNPNKELIALLVPDKLKQLTELDEETRFMIGEEIRTQNAVKPHPAFGYIEKPDNRTTWYRVP